MSKYLLGFPSIQVSSLFDKQRTLRLEMYLESGFSMLGINSILLSAQTAQHESKPAPAISQCCDFGTGHLWLS